jgi:hypothetical protein
MGERHAGSSQSRASGARGADDPGGGRGEIHAEVRIKAPDIKIFTQDTRWFRRLRKEQGWVAIPLARYEKIQGTIHSLIPTGNLGEIKINEDEGTLVAVSTRVGHFVKGMESAVSE